MSRVVAIGEETELTGYALAGVEILPADDPEQVQQAWASLADVGLVLLTARARGALPDPVDRHDLLWVVLPG